MSNEGLDFDAREAVHDRGEALIKQARRFRGAESLGLCGRCERAHIFRVKHKTCPYIICNVTKMQVPGEISECNKFQNEGVLSIWDLASLAKVIDNRDSYKGDYR